jgi:hypothetical protein
MTTSAYISRESLTAVLDAARKKLGEKTRKQNKTQTDTTVEDLEESIQQHLHFVNNWSKEVNFSDLKRPRRIDEIFVQIDISVLPKRRRIVPTEEIDSIPLKRLFDHDPHNIILLGPPGAGKTTSIKFICQAMIHGEEDYAHEYLFPLLIRLRDLNGFQASPESTLLIDRIMTTLGLRINFAPLTAKFTHENAQLASSIFAERRAIRERVILRVLDELQVLLILEGFDEIALLKDRQQIISEISTLSLNLNRSRLLVTSRTGDFPFIIDRAIQYEVAPLTEKQISTFARKWLSDDQKASRFLKSVKGSPFKDTAIRPLTLAHLCAIYDRVGKIPEKPKSVYYKIISLLLEEWDEQRRITRESRYAQFDVRRKFEFLCELAYDLTVTLHKSLFTKDELISVYLNIHRDFGLPAGEAEQVVSELETHTGLILKSGYHDFEFAHKSLQEYLAAEYLVRLPSLPPARLLFTIPNELAVAVTASSKPSEYLNELVFHRLNGKGLSNDFMGSFLNRLFLEKPDFDVNVKLGLAVVVFASLYWEGGTQRSSESTSTSVVSRYIDKLIELAVTRTSLDVIRTYYDRIGTAKLDGLDYQRLKKRIVRSSDALPNLPDSLYVAESLFNRMSN